MLSECRTPVLELRPRLLELRARSSDVLRAPMSTDVLPSPFSDACCDTRPRQPVASLQQSK